MKNKLFSAALFLLGTIFLYSCSKDDSNGVQPPKGPYSDGIFILNEGWFGHELGSVNFYAYSGQDTLITGVYARENGNTAPTTTGATLENGFIFNDRLYLISKAGGPIVIADAATMKGVGSIQMDNSDFRDIATLDDQKAVVSTDKGILALDLSGLTVNATPVAGDGPVKDLLYADSHVYAAAHGGVDIYNPVTWALDKHYDGPTEGYVRTPDGMIYGAADKLLVAINPTTLDTAQIVLAEAINTNDFGYSKAAIVASGKNNSVYYVAASADYMPRMIYKYDKGNAASVQQPFITLPAGEQFYGTGIGYDQKNNMIVTTSITGYGEDDKNYLRFYDATTGGLKKSVSYGHPYFPALLVFHP